MNHSPTPFPFLLAALLPAAVLLVVAGCGEKTIPPEEAYTPEDRQGTVDPSLPAPSRQKQEVIKRVFDGLQENVDFEEIAEYLSDVTFTETYDSFYGDAIGLAGWDFGGKPAGDDVPVVLHLAMDSTGEEEQEVERVYTVTSSRGRHTISRKR